MVKAVRDSNRPAGEMATILVSKRQERVERDTMTGLTKRSGVATVALGVAVLICGNWVFVGRRTAAAEPEEVRVIDTVREVFVAAAGDDLGKFHAVTTVDFYAYDNGTRF